MSEVKTAELVLDEIVEKDGEKTISFYLSDGKLCVVKAGKGIDVIKAQTEMRAALKDDKITEEGLIINLMSKMVTVDGQKITGKQLDNIGMGNFLKIQQNFGLLNFM